jgi:hypothetical protein
MVLFRNGIDLSNRLSSFISSSKNLLVLVPYIKLEPLKEILSSTNCCRAIIVRWEINDLILGSSDLELYQFCKENSIVLYRNPRIHLKAFIDNYRSCIIGSPNISSRALNLPKTNMYNFEVATLIDNLTFEDRIYFNRIINESTLITDSIYEQIKMQLQARKEFVYESESEFVIESNDNSFLISSLPMTLTVQKLLEICATKHTSNELELNCAIHDLVLYGISLDMEHNAIMDKLKVEFFKHPFIRAFLNNLGRSGEIYFGAAKEWIHNNCTDVPIPRKWEITENIQILYRWIVDLGDGKYSIDVPGAHSQRLKSN